MDMIYQGTNNTPLAATRLSKERKGYIAHYNPVEYKPINNRVS